MQLTIANADDIQIHEDRVRDASVRAIGELFAREGEERGLRLFYAMRFEEIGRHPLEERKLNLIEQINQTFTYLVSFRSLRFLFEH